MKKPTIYEIKELTKKSSPNFFSADTMRFFGQRLSDFKVYKTDCKHKFLIVAYSRKPELKDYKTEKIFNALTNELERIENA